eukprot:scaffold37676_cov21-Tisochrysis_lutea.AAC.3
MRIQPHTADLCNTLLCFPHTCSGSHRGASPGGVHAHDKVWVVGAGGGLRSRVWLCAQGAGAY